MFLEACINKIRKKVSFFFKNLCVGAQVFSDALFTRSKNPVECAFVLLRTQNKSANLLLQKLIGSVKYKFQT